MARTPVPLAQSKATSSRSAKDKVAVYRLWCRWRQLCRAIPPELRNKPFATGAEIPALTSARPAAIPARTEINSHGARQAVLLVILVYTVSSALIFFFAVVIGISTIGMLQRPVRVTKKEYVDPLEFDSMVSNQKPGVSPSCLKSGSLSGFSSTPLAQKPH